MKPEAREALAEFLYVKITGWVQEFYDASGIGITPWEEVPPAIRESWYADAEELWALVMKWAT